MLGKFIVSALAAASSWAGLSSHPELKQSHEQVVARRSLNLAASATSAVNFWTQQAGSADKQGRYDGTPGPHTCKITHKYQVAGATFTTPIASAGTKNQGTQGWLYTFVYTNGSSSVTALDGKLNKQWSVPAPQVHLQAGSIGAYNSAQNSVGLVDWLGNVHILDGLTGNTTSSPKNTLGKVQCNVPTYTDDNSLAFVHAGSKFWVVSPTDGGQAGFGHIKESRSVSCLGSNSDQYHVNSPAYGVMGGEAYVFSIGTDTSNATTYDSVVALNATSGKPLWTFKGCQGTTAGPPVFVPSQGLVLMSCNTIVKAGTLFTGGVYAIDASSGEQAGFAAAEGKISGSPVVNQNQTMAYFAGANKGGNKGAFYGVSLPLMTSQVSNQKNPEAVVTSLALDSDGHVYGGSTTSMYAFDANVGDVEWMVSLGAQPTAPMLMSGQVVFAADDTVYSIGSNGAACSQGPTPSPTPVAPSPPLPPTPKPTPGHTHAPPTTTTFNQTGTTGNGLKPGAKAAIALVVIVAAFAIGGLVFYCVVAQRRKQQQYKSLAGGNTNYGGGATEGGAGYQTL